MDIIYSLREFNITDDTDAMDVLYWYSAYQKEKKEAAEEERRRHNRLKLRRA